MVAITRSAARRISAVKPGIPNYAAICGMSKNPACKVPFAKQLAPLLLQCVALSAQRGDGGATPTLPTHNMWGNPIDYSDYEPTDPEEGLYEGPILYDPDGMPLDPRDGSRLYATMDECHLYDFYDNTPVDPTTGDRLYTYRAGHPANDFPLQIASASQAQAAALG